MSFTLHSGHFFPELESAFSGVLRQALRDRRDALREQILVVTPTAALRARLLESSLPSFGSLYGVPFVSIHPLCAQIAAAAPRQEPARLVTDSLYYATLIQRIAGVEEWLHSSNLRICRALYQSVRDLQEGGIQPELLADVLEAAESDPELQGQLHPRWLRPLALILERLQQRMRELGIVNLPLATRFAADSADAYVRSKNIRALLVYGFYDATETQFAVLENLARAVAAGGDPAHVFFPFPVDSASRVEHPFGYSQGFLDRLVSLSASLGGGVLRLPRGGDGASAGCERRLFQPAPLPAPTPAPHAPGKSNRKNPQGQLGLFDAPAAEPQPAADAAIEVSSAAGAYDEAWVVAKEILALVLDRGVSLDQIVVVSRSGGADLAPLQHVLRENEIPFRTKEAGTLAMHPYAAFANLVLQAREAELAPSILLELLSSPFVSVTGHSDFRALARLLRELLIRNWGDWSRLEPLLNREQLPAFYAFLEDDAPPDVEALREMVVRIRRIKDTLEIIPENASLPQFARMFHHALLALGDGAAPESEPVLELVRRLADYRGVEKPEWTLGGFIDFFRIALKETPWGPAALSAAEAAVTLTDIMEIRGVSADYVFVTGLNREIFPRRTQEDPFLPDSTRRALREVTGAGPAEKRARTLLPLKEGTDEELLLFGLALRMARKQLHLSFQRTDEAGKKSGVSNYLDELMRILTGAASENNPRIRAVPRHQASKFQEGALPTLTECASLNTLYSRDAMLQLHGVDAAYADHLRQFSGRLNDLEPETALDLDGIIGDPASLWRNDRPDRETLTVSYSRLKTYLQCPFQYFGKHVLQLEESPRDIEEEEHDLSAPLKGRIAEDVVKFSIQKLRDEPGAGLREAVQHAVREVRARYGPTLPPVLLETYIERFRAAGTELLGYLKRHAYDLGASSTPQHEDMIQMVLLPAAGELPSLTVRGIPDLILQRQGRDALIGELKWGTRNVGKSIGLVFSNNEAQFCIYPELVYVNQEERLPFQYLRLDVFESYGSPDDLLHRLRQLAGPKGDVENAVRVYGLFVEYERTLEHLEKVKARAGLLREGRFRIVKDPASLFGPCRLCSFTQICRRSHTGTLLRAKRAGEA